MEIDVGDREEFLNGFFCIQNDLGKMEEGGGVGMVEKGLGTVSNTLKMSS